MDNQKRFKSIILNSIIIGMTVFYIFSPLQKEIYNLAHHLSHQLSSLHTTHESSHHHGDKHHDHDEVHDHTHEFIETGLVGKTLTTDNEVYEEEHSHQMLAFFNTLFNSNDTSTDQEQYLAPFQLDKHIIPHINVSLADQSYSENSNIWFRQLNLDSRKADVIAPPPDYLYSIGSTITK